MGTLVLPDSRFEMPELFEPGRKPVGNVKIDLSSQLILDGDRMLDFSKLTTHGNTKIERNRYITKNAGDYVTFDGYDYPANSDLTVTINLKKLSIGTGTNPGFWRSGNDFFIMNGSTRGPWVRWGGVNLFDTGSYIIPDGDCIITYAVKNASEAKCFINGKLSSKVTHSSSTPGGSVDLIGYQLALDEGIHGEYELILLHNRYLLDHEIKSLHTNPYQFLIPA